MLFIATYWEWYMAQFSDLSNEASFGLAVVGIILTFGGVVVIPSVLYENLDDY